MKITISSGKPADPRDVTVEDEGMVPLSFKAKSLDEAHKTLKQGFKDGCDSLRPAKGK